MGYRQWAGTDMPGKEASQVATGHTQPVRKVLDIAVIESTVGNES